MPKQARESETFRFLVRKDGILEIRAVPGSVHDGPAAEKNVGIAAELTGSGKRPVLVFVDGAKSVTFEARRVYQREETVRDFTAVALVARSPLARLLANFFLGMTRPPVEIGHFDDETDAVEWLLGESGRDL